MALLLRLQWPLRLRWQAVFRPTAADRRPILAHFICAECCNATLGCITGWTRMCGWCVALWIASLHVPLDGLAQAVNPKLDCSHSPYCSTSWNSERCSGRTPLRRHVLAVAGTPTLRMTFPTRPAQWCAQSPSTATAASTAPPVARTPRVCSSCAACLCWWTATLTCCGQL